MKHGQVSVELVMMASITMGILLVAYLVNDSLSSSWERQKQALQASFAADSFALQIGKAVSGGNGASIRYFNSVSPDVSSMELDGGRLVIAHTMSGASASSSLVTGNITAPGGIPVNEELLLRNVDGEIFVDVT